MGQAICSPPPSCGPVPVQALASAIVTTATTEAISWGSGAWFQLWKVLNPSCQVSRICKDLSGYLGMSLTAGGSSLVTVQNQNVWSIRLAPGGHPGARRLHASIRVPSARLLNSTFLKC